MITEITGVGVLAVVRLGRPMSYEAAVALRAGGITAIEITLTTPGALETIASIRGQLSDATVGAGTVVDATAARNAIAAGAQFLVSPTMDDDVARLARDSNVFYIPGAFTPNEMLRAHQMGASLIKVFPSAQTGPSYIRDVLAPLPFLRLVPSGGVNIITVGAWIAAGAAAVSVGTSMINERTTAPVALAGLADNARSLVAAVAAARKAMSPA